MHYYSFNIADYRKDTAHLTPIEHYIYRTLIDWCYLDESGIPKITQVVMRRLGLGSEMEPSLLNVLSDFFSEGENAWFHTRISSEIEGYHANSNKNRENGKKGGRPKKQQVTYLEKPKKTHPVNLANPNESETKGKPITNNHKPIEEPISDEIVTCADSGESLPSPRKQKPISATDLIQSLEGLSLSVANDYLQFRKQKKAPLNATAWKSICREVMKTSATPDEAIGEAMNAGWTGFKADWYANRISSGANKGGGTVTDHNMAEISKWLARDEQ